ncbi:class I SAM-dependent methyltransferase [Vibrio breoganii]
MEEHVYKTMYHQQSNHWWYLARKEILISYLDIHLNNTKNSKGLEVGAGTGVNTKILTRYTVLDVVEQNPFSIALLRRNSCIKVIEGFYPEVLSYRTTKYDNIFMFDVLEHIKYDKDTLNFTNKLLNTNGTLFLTVPSYQFLFSSHDKEMHHFRRYSKKRLEKLLESENFEIIESNYFNFLLFPFALISRMIGKIGLSFYRQEQKIPNKLLNQLFFNIFRLEKKLLPYIKFPWGLSIFICARKRNS